MKPNLSSYLMFILIILVSCKNPYRVETIVFTSGKNTLINKLHNEFDFKNIDFSGISLDLDGHQTIDLQVKINGPIFTGREALFAQKLAKSVKKHIANINHFNVISVEITVLETLASGYNGKMKKILLDQKTLKEISSNKYFNM